MPAGRPTKLTKQIIEEAKRYLPKLVYLEILADCIGVAPATISRWLRRGKRLWRKKELTPDDELYIEFRQAIKKGLADAEIERVDKILNDASWQSQAWILERRFKKRWSTNTKEIREILKRLDKLEKEDNGNRKPNGPPGKKSGE